MFTIDTDNNIEFVTESPSELLMRIHKFDSQIELTALDLPRSRLESIWNSFAGVPPFAELKPVKKFESSTHGVQRIWNAIQRLAVGVESAPFAVTEPAPEVSIPQPEPKRPSARKAKVTKTPKPIREGSKKEEVLRMIQRARGATLAELIDFLGWNDKSVRALVGRLGVPVRSEKHETKGRVYRIAA